MPKKKKGAGTWEIWSWTALSALVLIVLVEATFSLTNAWELSTLTSNLRRLSTGSSVLLEEKSRMAADAVREKEEMQKEMGGDDALAVSPRADFVLRGTNACSAYTFNLKDDGDGYAVRATLAEGAEQQDIGSVLVQDLADYVRRPMLDPWELYFRNDRIAVGAQWGAPVYSEFEEIGCDVWISEK